MAWILSGAGALTAQAADGAGKPQLPKRLFVDSVVASVNDSAILQSKVFAASSGDILGKESEYGGPLPLRAVAELTTQALRKLISDYQMAQSARSFGNIPPDRFDMILESQLEQDKEDLRRDLGSYGELSAELDRTGQTWRTYADGQRIEKLQMLAEQFSIWERVRKQSNLYLTPRMLRETYEEFRGQFQAEASATVEIVTFKGADALATAQAASDTWADQVLTARELAAKYSGSLPLDAMRAKSLPAVLRDFALKGPIANVSQPIPRGNGVYAVAKIMDFRPARDGKFEDPEVQAQVREIASKKVILEFRGQALGRARNRTEVWIYENGRRLQFR